MSGLALALVAVLLLAFGLLACVLACLRLTARAILRFLVRQVLDVLFAELDARERRMTLDDELERHRRRLGRGTRHESPGS